jgi:hypothetical protein
MALVLSDDLWRYDAQSEQLEMVLDPGDGGNFLFSPDGERLALMRPGRIELMDADGGAPREIFTHAPVKMASEDNFYAQPVWAADSHALAVAIPPAEPAAVEARPSAIWRIPVDDEPAQFLGELTTLPGLQTPPLIAPDLAWIGALTSARAAAYTDSNYPSLAVTQLDETIADTPLLVVPDAINLHGWSPDSARLLYQSPAAEVMELSVVQEGTRELFTGEETGRVGSVRWTDKFRYLFIHYAGDGWQIRLGIVDGSDPQLVAEGESFPPGYDFAWGTVEE